MELKQAAERHLTSVILPFWSELRDERRGGYVGYVGYDLKADASAPKGCIQNSRILWFFSQAYAQLKTPALLECASHAYRYLDRFIDKREGGLYWMCTADGEPMDDTKHTYNHAFAIYALAAYARASGKEKALHQALKLFELIESRMTRNGQYLDAFTRAFKPHKNLKLSDNPTLLARGVVAEKTMNTILHLLEAYTLLYDVGKDPRVLARLKYLLSLLMNTVYDPLQNRLLVYFDRDMRSLIDMQSYGHDIEASWLWDLAADAALTGEERAQVKRVTSRLAQGVLDRAFLGGSLQNEIVEGVADTRRIWWVQAETMVGMLNLWQKTGDVALRRQMDALWQYIETHLVDHRQNGEWYAMLDETGVPTRLPIADPWKAPYHNGRMCLEMIKRL
ncbi:MAG TPA: AGE family epimerase/isomerase [Candidatus Limiplasma sp.]|nr:AGE family epimerase/isomerase [Candidatus Limiplasma sp.]HRX07804.1 AGE family epimerase/isomerase [Candidatus Limiplasma sp.]